MPKNPSVPDWLDALDHPQKDALIELCAVIRGVDPRITEEIKWHAPSFAITDHFATTGLPGKGGGVHLILHTGAKVKPREARVPLDEQGLPLQWRGLDRAVLLFSDLDDVSEKATALRSVLAQWIAATQ